VKALYPVFVDSAKVVYLNLPNVPSDDGDDEVVVGLRECRGVISVAAFATSRAES